MQKVTAKRTERTAASERQNQANGGRAAVSALLEMIEERQKQLEKESASASRSTLMPANTTELEKRLWGAADELRANSKLKSSEYSVPVLGLIFLRYADHKFAAAEAKLTSQGSGRRTIGKADYQAQGVLFLPESARFSNLLNLPEREDIGKAINDGMRANCSQERSARDVIEVPSGIAVKADRSFGRLNSVATYALSLGPASFSLRRLCQPHASSQSG